jgi:hypothetical protein
MASLGVFAVCMQSCIGVATVVRVMWYAVTSLLLTKLVSSDHNSIFCREMTRNAIGKPTPRFVNPAQDAVVSILEPSGATRHEDDKPTPSVLTLVV